MNKNNKKLSRQFKIANKEAFINSLPLSQEEFAHLFNFLDKELEYNSCNHTKELTISYLKDQEFSNIEQVIKWLENNGGYCDCEILANVEEKFED